MTETSRSCRTMELWLMVLSCLAVSSVVMANVIRVAISANAAFATRAVLFGACWIAAILWAKHAGERFAIRWLIMIVFCTALIAICQAFAGGVSIPVLVQISGGAGAGLGAALLIKRATLGDRLALVAGLVAVFGIIAAVWLALEPRFELWKLLPNDWEVSKNLKYRWGIRMGQDRARFLFDTPMEAGVVQWFCGVLCLLIAMEPDSSKQRRYIWAALTIALFASVSLTYSRAGLVLASISVGVGVLARIRGKRATFLIGGAAASVVLVIGIIAARMISDESPAMRNIASILDPNEEANRIRLSQFAKMGTDLTETPWHGRGAGSFVTFADAPRMPEHESSPVNLICAFGVGGVAMVGALAFAHFSQWRRFATILADDSQAQSRFDRLAATLAIPFAAYSLVSPIFAGMIFGMICLTIIGLLAIWDTPLGVRSGKP